MYRLAGFSVAGPNLTEPLSSPLETESQNGQVAKWTLRPPG